MLRLAGGRAAVFHEGTMEIGHAVPEDEPRAGIHERFEGTAGRSARALGRLGVDARVGEVPGEYCPGRYSVNARGAAKLAGIGQRIVAGGSHTGVVLVVSGEERIDEVLRPVYDGTRPRLAARGDRVRGGGATGNELGRRARRGARGIRP